MFILSACKGEQGGPGAPGAPGASCTVTESEGAKTITCADGTSVTIRDGQPGVADGAVTGVVTSDLGGAIEGVAVATVPDRGVTATTDAEGKFSLDLPLGSFTLTFTHADYETKEVADVAVTSGAAIDLQVSLKRVNPLVAKGATIEQAGFGKQVKLSANVTGATGELTWSWTQKSGPTTVALSSGSAAEPTFDTASLESILSSGKIRYVERAERPGFLALTAQQVKDMTYTFEATVTDGTFTTKATVSVVPASVVAGIENQPKGVMAIANDAEAETYAWTMTVKPSASNAVLEGADTRNPWFVPDETGEYTLTNGDTALTMRVGTWVGAESSSGCKLCHSGGPGGDQYTAWKQTGHANLFREGIEGVASDHYGSNCISCHVVGYNTAADNNGFDDVARETGWTFPAHPGEGEWDKVPAELKTLAGVQCESCHGPGSGHSGASQPMPNSMDSAVCGTCHDSMTHHDRFPLWAQSTHANLELALDEGTYESRGNTAAHCGRCHAAEGFRVWVEQLKAGNPGNIAIPSGAVAADYLKGIGLTRGTVHSITCQACHDPHTLELRISGDVPTLPSGFEARGVGSGAICIACHNTRNGLHDDAHPQSNYSAPHVASQADVFMGQNLYFVQPGQLSAHAAIEGTCVKCHLEQIPANVTAATTNHTFTADRSNCGECHGEGVTGEAQAGQFEMLLEQLGEAAGAKVIGTLSGIIDSGGTYSVRAWNPTTDTYSSASGSTVTLSALPVSAVPEEVHGQMGFKLTMPSSVQITYTDGSTTDSTEVYFQLGSLVEDSVSANPIPASSTVVKALWNYYVLHGDGSEGVHNPGLTVQALRASIAALEEN